MHPGKQPTFGDILQELTRPLLDQSPIRQLSSHVRGIIIRASFWRPNALSGVKRRDAGIWKPLHAPADGFVVKVSARGSEGRWFDTRVPHFLIKSSGQATNALVPLSKIGTS